MSQPSARKHITNTELLAMKVRGEKIVSLTAYDASFAHILDKAGVEMILVGDSLGMVVQGQSTTVPVTIEEMAYHSKLVSRGIERALLVTDMPFMSYPDPHSAVENAAVLMQQGHAHMVKLEGGQKILDSVEHLVNQGIPVCGHLGLLPQSVNQLGGYKVQGKEDAEANIIIHDAKCLQQAGASAIVVECIPASLAEKITQAVDIPIIGIGAGVNCDGQVLVSYDMLDITVGKRPKFSKNFMLEAGNVADAVGAYVSAVKNKTFPSQEHSF
ncbi:MAG TPA: 3-methyl-2-oxobutanoate hydroxymethyltransferase [Cycloclasticus sp.]|jgi:3-methyl-2-oxobutanoate hydroxymethyltransferase|nr:3-methyl-2-oxobutanoate hydroxymethyltransferase [Cycloclasticus sp.]HIL93199.1 3-methyl-2-oxobutanoate hydroxymethyltransferase [Cycloclasticus sp.]